MKLIFMGTPDFAVPCLQALIDSKDHEVVAVYSQPPRPAGRGHKLSPSPVHQCAEQAGIPVYTPASLKDEQAQASFAGHGSEAAIVAAYGLILPQAILDACPKGCLNIHPSDLPRWRGAAPIQHTILAGDESTSMCIMQMDAGLDTGDVLWREPVAIPEGVTAGELHDLMAQLGAKCLLKVLEQFEQLTPQPQQGEPLYAHKITKEDARIDWQQSAQAIVQQIRAMNPYPGAHTQLHGQTIKIFDALISNLSSQAEPGTVLDEQLTIACGDRALHVTALQRPGKPRMAAEDALRGWAVPVGSKAE